jgi:hypothetical protein
VAGGLTVGVLLMILWRWSSDPPLVDEAALARAPVGGNVSQGGAEAPAAAAPAPAAAPASRLLRHGRSGCHSQRHDGTRGHRQYGQRQFSAHTTLLDDWRDSVPDFVAAAATLCRRDRLP